VLVVGPEPNVPQTAQAPARDEPAPRAARREETAPVAKPVAAPREVAAAMEARTENRPASSGRAEAASGEQAPQIAPTGPEPALVLLLPPTAAAAPRALSGPPAGDAPATALGLDLVDYDDSNTMRFAGTAPPGARVRVYSDDRHLGDAAADPAGRWSLTPAEAPPVGRHTLRVDQIGARAMAPTVTPAAAGPEVSGRIEVAFQRESLPPDAVRDGQVVVQPGNNLWRIARDTYGRGIRYTVIHRANQAQIRNPARIYPGQVFAVPEPR
jgi:nucleoid-associated protein YgaU